MPEPQKQGSDMPPFNDILKQLIFEDPQEIAKKETGKKISAKIYADQTGQTNNLNFFAARALRWSEIEKWALGKQNMEEFLPYMNVSDANKSYANIDMTPIMILPQFINTIVESIAKNEEYPCVSAIDPDSEDEKDNRKIEAIYRMKEVENVDQLQQAGGMVLEDPMAYVPDNEQSAEVYFELEDRLPKEIKFEKKLENVLIENQYERVLKRRMIHDNICFNLEATKIEKEGDGKYCIRKCIPRNVFYNFFISDTGKSEIEYIGECYNLKAKDIRKKYGISPSNPNGLTEKEVYELVKLSARQTPLVNFAHLWGEQYATFNNVTPWDDYSVYVLDYEIKVVVSDYYVSKVDGYGKENIVPKKSIPTPTSEKATVKKKNTDKIYRGVYAPYARQMIYWGLPDLNMAEPLFSYSIIIPSNTGEYIPSLAERALEPCREYALTKLKRKLLIGMLSPSQYRIDVESARNITTGTGAVMPWEEILKIKLLTGVELWSSKGLNPLEREAPPFSPATADPTINNIIELTNLLTSIENEIRSLIGASIYLDGSTLPGRTANNLAENQIATSANVTNYIPNAHNQVMEETLYKICLMSWQDVVKTEKESSNDLINTRFKVYVRMKQTEYERELLEKNIDTWSKTVDGNGMPLLSPNDVFAIRQIKNGKLAEKYLANKVEENRRNAAKQKQADIDANAKLQQESNDQAAQKAIQLQKDKLDDEKDMADFKATKEKEIELLKGFLVVCAKDESGNLIKQLMPAIQQLVPNIAIPLAAENKQMSETIQANAMQEQIENEQASQEVSEGPQQTNIPQQQIA